MNSSKIELQVINENYLYLEKETWFEVLGSNRLSDEIYLYALTPISILATVLNLVSFVVLLKRKKQTTAISLYLRLYILTSLLISLMQSLVFLHKSYGYLKLSNSYEAFFYRTYIYTPTLNALTQFQGFLDALISLNRLRACLPRLKHKLPIPPLMICLCLFLVSILVSIQYIFTSSLHILTVKPSPTESLTLYMIQETNFTLSTSGEYLNSINYVLRDILVYLVVIILNVITLPKLKKILKEKKSTTNDNNVNLDQTNTLEINKTITALVLCLISIIEHVVLIYVDFGMYSYDDASFNYMKCLFDSVEALAISIKQLANFFIFVLFLKAFRQDLKNLFGKSN